jgi:hypothetical protein
VVRAKVGVASMVDQATRSVVLRATLLFHPCSFEFSSSGLVT